MTTYRATESPRRATPGSARRAAVRASGGRGGAPRRPGWVFVTLLACLLAGWGTFATWTSRAAGLSEVTAGDLNFSLTAVSWNSPTAGLSGADAASLAAAVLGGGDVLVIDQQLQTGFAGNNLQVEFGLAWLGLPVDWVLTWHVADSTGSQVAPALGDAPLANQLVVPNATASSSWHIVVRVTIGDSLTIYDSPAGAPAPTSLSLGAMTISANQVREVS